MIFELYKEDQYFMIDLLHHTHLTGLIKNIRRAKISQECDEFILCKLALNDAEELVGQLSFEANHNMNKRVAQRSSEIADNIESQLNCRDA